MNLKTAGGKVPIQTGDPTHPWMLVDFPAWEDFQNLWGHQIQKSNLPRYYELLKARAGGASFADVARAQGITLERVRQIEAKFLRLMQKGRA